MPENEFVEEDPMELVGMVFPGEEGQLESMAESIVEEYVRMGWDEKRLMTLFLHPMFLATHRIYQQKGDLYVKELVGRICKKYNNIRQFQFGVVDEPLSPVSHLTKLEEVENA